jgi:hypothetical protein
LELHSDKELQYESEIFTEVCELMGIVKTRCTTMNPQSNGFLEHVNHTICDMINCLMVDSPFSWNQLLRLAMLAYNTSVQESTQETPAIMMFGRQLILPLDLAGPNLLPDGKIDEFNCEQEYVLKLQKKLHLVHDTAREKMKHAALKQSKQYNNRLKLIEYEEGSQVYYYYPVKTHDSGKECYYQWQGPYNVVSKLCDSLYRIQKGPRFKSFVVHHNKLKPALCRNEVDTSWIRSPGELHEVVHNESNVENELAEPSSRPKRNILSRLGDWYMGD